MKKILILIITIYSVNICYSQVLISNNTGTPHSSAMLEVRSNSKGILIPRMTSTERNAISGTPGLLVYDTNLQAFFMRGQSEWINISSSAEIWTRSSSNVYLTDPADNIGIGTSSPDSKFVVKADKGENQDAVLFEVKDEFDIPIFQVTSSGVRIFVKDETDSKAVSGGFAVGRYGAAKGLPDTTYFSVTPYQTEVNTKQPTGKAVSGGFAVGRYGAAKGITTPIFTTNPDSTRIYTVTDAKAVSGGFAVGRYGAAKAPSDNYMHISKENYFIGHGSGQAITSGQYNLFLGYLSGYSNRTGTRNTFLGHYAGYFNRWGDNNIYIGDSSGYNTIYAHDNIFIGNSAGLHTEADDPLYGSQNVFVGNFSGYKNLEGFYNVYIGQNSGYGNLNGYGNVFVGGLAGEDNLNNDNTFVGGASLKNNTSGNGNTALGAYTGGSNLTGSRNVFLGRYAGYNETGSDKLYIESGGSSLNSTTSLIYGDFNTNYLRLNAQVAFGETASPYTVLEIENLGNSNLGLDGDIVPHSSVTFDLGNNVSTEHWDQVWANSFNVYSDKNVKHDISNLEFGLEELLKLRPVSFKYNKNIDVSEKKRYGLIAQEVESVLPAVVISEDIDIDSDTGEFIVRKGDYKGINYSELIPVLIKSIQDQQGLILHLEEKVNRLEQHIKELK